MKLYLQIDEENDQVYVSFSEPTDQRGSVASTVQLAPDIHADFDREHRLLGLDLSNASRLLADGSLNEVSFDSLVGVKEASEIVGVKKPNFIRDYADAPGFPRPVVVLASGRVWLRSQIETYVTKLRRVRASSRPSRRRTPVS